jgi:hypothetical protein
MSPVDSTKLERDPEYEITDPSRLAELLVGMHRELIESQQDHVMFFSWELKESEADR